MGPYIVFKFVNGGWNLLGFSEKIPVAAKTTQEWVELPEVFFGGIRVRATIFGSLVYVHRSDADQALTNRTLSRSKNFASST